MTSVFIHYDARHINRYYATAATVTEVNYREDFIEARNYSRVFIIKGADDWQVGDTVSILLDSKNTAKIIDDEIVNTRYVRLTQEDGDLWIVNSMIP